MADPISSRTAGRANGYSTYNRLIMDDLSMEREQIDLLNQKAWDIRVNDSVQAGLLSAEATAKARNINYRQGIAEGLRTQGFTRIRQSRHDEAIE